MLYGFGSKERKRTTQAPLYLPEESTGTIEITISDQRNQRRRNSGARACQMQVVPGYVPALFGEETGLWGCRSMEILVFFLTKVQSSSTWTWESLRS